MPLIGCIADDVTGATDIAAMIARTGLGVDFRVGVPPAGNASEAGAVVVALRSRTAPRTEAIGACTAAAEWMIAQKTQTLYFKYCSTFDSTADGNIGPVADALQDLTGEPMSILCPAFPENGRTVYRGHLFVKDALLSESGMENHPLTPMRDPNLVRFFGLQTARAVAGLGYEIVEEGPKAIETALSRLRGRGVRHVIVDALCDRHLRSIAEAVRSHRLLSGGSALGRDLAQLAHGIERPLRAPARATTSVAAPAPRGAVVLAGSCSQATRAQVLRASAAMPAMALDVLALAGDPQRLEHVIDWAAASLVSGAVLLSTSAEPAEVARIQAELGADSTAIVEGIFARLAPRLRERGACTIIVAGGETSGAVAEGLGVKTLRVGPEIAPGVPWLIDEREPRLALAFKSGNFGGENFFLDALRGP